MSCFRLNTSKNTINKENQKQQPVPPVIALIQFRTQPHRQWKQHHWETTQLWEREKREKQRLKKALQPALLLGKMFVSLHIKLGSRASLQRWLWEKEGFSLYQGPQTSEADPGHYRLTDMDLCESRCFKQCTHHPFAFAFHIGLHIQPIIRQSA